MKIILNQSPTSTLLYHHPLFPTLAEVVMTDALQAARDTLQGWADELHAGVPSSTIVMSSLLAANILVGLFCLFAKLVAVGDRVGRGFVRLQGAVLRRVRVPLGGAVAIWALGRVLAAGSK
jgi:uncharacterized membrane protein